MKKFLKITGITIVLIIALLILIPVIFQDKLVEIAKTEINNQVNAKIDFGTFDLSIFTYFPNLNFEINDVTVSGINHFEGDTLLQLKQMSVKVDIMSVFGDQIEVLGIHLIEPNIYAHVLPDTSANWDIAKASEDTATPTEDAATETEDEGSFSLALKEFSIQKANIIYKDEPGDMMADLKNLDYHLEGDLSLVDVKLKMGLLVEVVTVEMEGIPYLNQTNIAYNAGIDANLETMRFDLLENKFRMNHLILSLAGYLKMNEDDSYDMDLSFGTNKNQFKDLLSLVPKIYTQDYNDIKTTGVLDLSGFAKGTYAENQLPAFNLNLNIDNAAVQYPDLPASIDQIYVHLIVDNKDGVEDHTLIDLKRFNLNLAGNPFSARYTAKTPISDPYIDGYVKGSIDFDKLKNAIPLDSMSISGLMQMDVTMRGNLSTIEQERYDEFEAKGQIALQNFEYKAADLDYDVLVESTQFDVAPKYFTLNHFDAKVGRSDFHATGRIDNFIAYYLKDEVLSGAFNLSSNLIDGGELAGETSTETEATTTEAADETLAETQETSTETPMEVVELPKNIKFELNTDIKEILYDTYQIKNFKGQVHLNEGIAEMKPVSMNMIDGTINLSGKYDSKNIKEPKIDFNIEMLGFEINKMFETFNTVKKLAPIAENCKGLIDIKCNLDATLDQNMEPVLQTMNGAGRMTSKNVTIGGSEAFGMLASILKNDKYKSAKITDIDGSFIIENGNLIISPVDVKMNHSKATFGGRQNLDQSLDYVLNVNIPRSDLGDANKLIDGALALGGNLSKDVNLGDNINADIFITGTLNKPKFSIGAKDMVNNAKEQIKDKVKEEVKKVVDDTKAKAIAEAQKQADALMAEAEKQSQKLMEEANKQADNIRKNGKKAAEQAKAEAKKEIDKLIKEAGSNPIAKMAAKEAGKELQAEADKTADNLQKEANKKADQLVAETKKQTDNIKQKAKAEGDKLIADAKKL